MANEQFDYLNQVEGNTMFELTDISERFIEEPTKIGNGNVIHHMKIPKPPDPPRQRNVRKRTITTFIVVLVIALLAGIAIPLGLQLSASSLLEARLNFVRRVLQETPLIQGTGGNVSELAVGYFNAISVPCGAQYLDAVQLVLEQVDEVRRTGEYLAEDVNTFKNVDQRGAVLMGVRGGHALGDSLGVLRSLYGLGVRFIAPVHGCTTVWAGPSGLSDFGELVIREMNRLGVLIDLTGADEGLALDILSTTLSPVIFSEVSAASLCNSSIGISDFILQRLAVNGGIALVALEHCGDVDVDRALAHVERVRSVAGLAHVGLAGGGDPAMLLAELVRDRHWSIGAVKQLIGGNLLRVMEEVQAKASPSSAALEEWLPLDELDGNTYCRYPGM